MVGLYNYRAGGLQPGRNSGSTHRCKEYGLIINGAEPAPCGGGRLAVRKCTSLMMKYRPSLQTYFHLLHLRSTFITAYDQASYKPLKGFVSVKYMTKEFV